MNVISRINVIDSPGHSELDWEYAKRKAEDPNIKFEDVLREKIKEIEHEKRRSN